MTLLHSLNEMVRQQRIPSALLFVGPRGSGKAAAALHFAKEVMNDAQSAKKIDGLTHPDVHHFYPEGKVGLHSIDSMRILTSQVALKSLESKWKFFILHDADRMLPTSSNALLKTFEEPSSHTCIILLATQQEKLLPTIISRCQVVSFTPMAPQGNYESEKRLKSLLQQPKPLSFPALTKAIEEIASSLEEEKKEKSAPYESDFALLEIFLQHYRDLYLKAPDSSAPFSLVHKEVAKARLALERSMKFSLTLETLCLKFL